MAHHLPVELWMEVASYLEDEAFSLPIYARVCRQWQPVFERLIYRQLKVESEEGAQMEKGAISLSQFQALMSGPSQHRRLLLRRLHYTITTPYEIEDYRAMKLEDQRYSEKNPVRDANNEAFSKGICALFNILETWDSDLKLTLAIIVQGRDLTLEPETKEAEDLGRWQTVLDGEQWVIPPYHARFPDEGPAIPRVSCVDELLFEKNYSYQGVWSGAAVQIAEHCVALRRLYLDLEELVRPDHLTYILERRQALASAFPTLPSTLRSFELRINPDEPWSNMLPALDLLAGKSFDDFSSNLRNLSLNLRDLELTMVPVELDFLFPLDQNGNPTPETLSLHWPHLESLSVKALPMCLLSGEWLFDHDNAENLPDPATMTASAFFETQLMIEETEYFRSVMRIEHFHRFYSSVGYAAQRMPCLKTIRISMVETPDTQLKFTSGRGAVAKGLIENNNNKNNNNNKPTLSFDSQSGYMPDERVAAAWRFRLDDLEVEDLGGDDVFHEVYVKVALDRFPVDQ